LRELGELEKRHADFVKRGLRIVAVSVDDREATELTQRLVPHLTVLGDPDRKMTEAFQAMHPGKGPGGSDIAAPTTFLLDSTGTVRWVFRPERVIVRLSPDELLAAVDEHLAAKK
jgi:peroxiredoxin